MSQNVLINTISKYKTFVYDRVETNVGNGYNVQTGNFTAPESGIYVFHTTTAAFDKSHSTIEIVANGQVKDITWADAMDHDDRAVASSMTVLSLTEGDVVYVRVGLLFGGNYLESNQYTRMSFSGFKLA
uniref:Complement C1q-like protein 4 n=1 Tax=Magallana gigas TaxID=29159 RepID=K1PYY5_MAGGI